LHFSNIENKIYIRLLKSQKSKVKN
jgi:hypothetical protein